MISGLRTAGLVLPMAYSWQFNKQSSGGTRSSLLIYRIALPGPNVMRNVCRCYVHSTGRNGDDFALIEFFAETDMYCTRQYGGVALVRMCVWRNYCSG